MSDPLNDGAAIQDDSAPIENTDSLVESETTAEVQAESQEPSADNQANINDAINRQHKKFRDEERRANELQTKLDAQAKELDGFKNQAPATVPEMPDPFDDDYDSKLKARDEALVEQAKYDASQNLVKQQQEQAQQQAAYEQQKQVNDSIQTYTKRATDYGISSEELQQAGNLVASYGVSNDLTMEILKDEDGPLITKYLAANPLELDSIRNMNLYQQANYINSSVRAKAVQLKPKNSNAPAPADTLSGNGVDPELGKYQFSKGASFT